MLIEVSDGPEVTLRPVRWQFPADAGEWDDQWLIISGTIDLGDRTWSFTDPCLLIGEARELATWLRQVAAGRVDSDREGEPSLSFMEPALGFSATAGDGDESVVYIHFNAEAAPPWLRDKDPHSAQHAVDLRVRPDQILAAAETWTDELNALPARSFTSTE